MGPLRRTRTFLLLTLLASPQVASAENPRATLNEIAQRSDLIVIGTVRSQTSRYQGKLIVTDVVLDEIRRIHAGPRSRQHSASTIVLQHAGGTVGDTTMAASDMPRFRTGARYLLFMFDDGESYFNPLVGGHQGKFEIIRDEAGEDEYPLAAGRRGILRSSGADLRQTKQRVAAVRNRAPAWKETAAQASIAPPSPADSLSRAEKFSSMPEED